MLKSQKISRRNILLLGVAGGVSASLAPAPASAQGQPVPQGNTYLGRSLVFNTPSPLLVFQKPVGAWSLKNPYRQTVAAGYSREAQVQLPELNEGYYLLNETWPIVVVSEVPQLDWWGACGNFTNQGFSFDPKQAVEDLQKIGGGSLRETYLWEEVEQPLGVYNLPSSTKERDEALEAHGVKLFFVGGNTHRAYGAWRRWDTPRLREGWVAYVQAVLTLNPKISHVEVGNEFNGSFNQGDKSPATYVELLKYAYPRLKKSHPHVEVVGGATAGAAHQFTEEVFKLGGGNFIDGWSLHPYSHTGNFIKEYGDKIRGWARVYGAPEPKIHISEFGWAVTPQENRSGNNARVPTEELQASNLAELGVAIFGAKAQGKVETAHWYNLVATEPTVSHSNPSFFTEREGWSKATEGAFGLFKQPDSSAPHTAIPRVSSFTFWLIVKLLAGRGCQGPTKIQTRKKEQWVNLYKFTQPGQHSIFALHVRLPWISGVEEAEELISIKAVLGTPVSKYWRAVHVDGTWETGFGDTLTIGRGVKFFQFSDYPFQSGPFSPPIGLNGGILSYWKRNGGTETFGNPVNNETSLGGGWYAQDFEKNRRIFWHKNQQGHIEIDSPIGNYWAKNGAEQTLGFPSNEPQASALTSWQDFLNQESKKTRLFSSEHGVYPLNLSGAIGRAWGRRGGLEGWGYPVSEEKSTGNLVIQEFSHGVEVRYKPSTRSISTRRKNRK